MTAEEFRIARAEFKPFCPRGTDWVEGKSNPIQFAGGHNSGWKTYCFPFPLQQHPVGGTFLLGVCWPLDVQRGRGPRLAGTDARYWCSVTSRGWKSILECWGSSQRAAHLPDMESRVYAPCASRHQCILRVKHNLPQLKICKHCSHRIMSSQTTSLFITSAVRVLLKK